MRTRLTAALLLLSCSLPAAGLTPWERYLDEPTPANAAAVRKIEYSPGRIPRGGYDFGDLSILQNQVLAADPQAFRLAWRLYQASDGGLLEDLGAMLGHVIRPHPAFFLAEVDRAGVPCSRFTWILQHEGLEYVDRPAAGRYELEMRRKALQSVTSRDLRTVRDQCLAALAK